ncbi:LysR family transcriptional regulator [Zoogloea sp.]|uniref:LysR family transcriptional regulator n=1 Tax=Zoogloea sp. TaxID=49181 RepID=UPI0014167661|nr:MAG: LysR family transcriptional regulator [Zoogloea sp.]
MDLKNFDLNLLLVFDQMLKERKVSAVADTLGVTQPAISRSLKRLRALLGDELFYRTANGMEPTSYARHLAEPVGEALDSLRSAISREFDFHPRSSRRSFTLRMSDSEEIYILPRLLRFLSGTAQGVCGKIVRDGARR